MSHRNPSRRGHAVYAKRPPRRRRLSGFCAARLRRLTGAVPPVLEKPKVTLAVLAGIVLPLVGLLCSIVILSEEKHS